MSIGLIAGSGIDFLSPAGEWTVEETPYGSASIARIGLGGKEVVLLRRHGPELNVPPHLINYRANLWALQQAGVGRVIATAAVGSMRRELQPGSLAVVCDFIDFTKRRDVTFFDRVGEAVMHVDFSTPYCPDISAVMEKAASECGAAPARVTYVCVDGPRYETPAEIKMFVQWGGDVVGMTGVPEVTLAGEMGMCYAALAVVANHAAGIVEGRLSHEEVLACVKAQQVRVKETLERTIAAISESRSCCVST